MAGILNTCELCGGEGFVEVRVPELDDVCMCEVTVAQPCTCEAGAEWEAANEGEDDDD